MKLLAVGLITLYQKIISPFLGPHCRFHPSCSKYALEAISTFGFFRGVQKSLTRLLKCQPFAPGGYDPVRS